jgi:hypothetical protein
MTTRWRANGAAPAGKDVDAVTGLLQSLRVLGRDRDYRGNEFEWTVRGTPPSVAILESGATALTKVWAIVLAAIGVAATVAAFMTHGWEDEPVEVRLVLLPSLAVLLAVLVLSVTLIVRGDVRARADGAVAMYQARAETAGAFLALTAAQNGRNGIERDDVLMAVAAVRGDLRVKGNGGDDWRTVVGVRVDEEDGVQFKVGEDWIGQDLISSYSTE